MIGGQTRLGGFVPLPVSIHACQLRGGFHL